MQVLGGIGVTGHRVGRFWRDLRIDRLSGGSDEMQILTLGRAELKSTASRTTKQYKPTIRIHTCPRK